MSQDYIKREYVAKGFDTIQNILHSLDDAIQKVRAVLIQLPDDDVEPVVRCHDCKNYENFKEGEGDAFYGWCNDLNICTPNSHYCAAGERRSE